MSRVPDRAVTDEYGNRVYLSLSGDGYRAHLNCVDRDGNDVIAHPPFAPPHGAPKPAPGVLGYASWGGGFWSPAGAIKLAHLLLQYALGNRAAADAAIRAGRAASSQPDTEVA